MLAFITTNRSVSDTRDTKHDNKINIIKQVYPAFYPGYICFFSLIIASILLLFVR